VATRVVNVAKTKNYDVYIGRGGKWGNPFIIGRDGTREEVIAKHAEWIEHGEGRYLLDSIHELYGKTLGCHCAPKPCHGCTLARLAVKYHIPSFFS
jgi:hypothetical protein